MSMINERTSPKITVGLCVVPWDIEIRLRGKQWAHNGIHPPSSASRCITPTVSLADVSGMSRGALDSALRERFNDVRVSPRRPANSWLTITFAGRMMSAAFQSVANVVLENKVVKVIHQ